MIEHEQLVASLSATDDEQPESKRPRLAGDDDQCAPADSTVASGGGDTSGDRLWERRFVPLDLKSCYAKVGLLRLFGRSKALGFSLNPI